MGGTTSYRYLTKFRFRAWHAVASGKAGSGNTSLKSKRSPEQLLLSNVPEEKKHDEYTQNRIQFLSLLICVFHVPNLEHRGKWIPHFDQSLLVRRVSWQVINTKVPP